ncbi:MAG: hypothetical protein EHM84_08420 [Lysobacterales bacterium]|nr:MAG: hypothetical protein EHM84_08420 [Xanthomonadales bacterium]
MLLQDSFGQNSAHVQGFDSFTGVQRRPAGSPSSIATRARIIASEEANAKKTRQIATKEMSCSPSSSSAEMHSAVFAC